MALSLRAANTDNFRAVREQGTDLSIALDRIHVGARNGRGTNTKKLALPAHHERPTRRNIAGHDKRDTVGQVARLAPDLRPESDTIAESRNLSTHLTIGNTALACWGARKESEADGTEQPLGVLASWTTVEPEPPRRGSISRVAGNMRRGEHQDVAEESRDRGIHRKADRVLAIRLDAQPAVRVLHHGISQHLAVRRPYELRQVMKTTDYTHDSMADKSLASSTCGSSESTSLLT